LDKKAITRRGERGISSSKKQKVQWSQSRRHEGRAKQSNQTKLEGKWGGGRQSLKKAMEKKG